ncbi:MAG: N-acetylmuramoyl-L-alanine amidase, partial [Muribaculaceae bacterium]|nr:N-acetylmuramoyl-L-alanine amidase [Muribaculaceae bacterium]
GAHCKGHNSNSIGVCYVGGLATDCKTPKDTRTARQKEALLQLINRLRSAYRGVRVRGHRDYARKDCPCFDATAEYG